LQEDADNNIWLAHDLGVSKYDRRKNEFTNYEFTTLFNLSANGGRVFNVFMDSQQRLWATTQNLQLVSYDPANDKWNYAQYEIPNQEQPVQTGMSIAITEDSKGGIWFGSYVYGLMYLPKSETAFKPISANNPNGFNFVENENHITAMLSDSNNILWITTRNGIYKFDPEKTTLKTILEYTEERTNAWNNWNRILSDPQGNIWISNNYRGILKFDGITDQYEEIVFAGKLKMSGYGWNITMTDFMIDRSGIFWFGSGGSGLVKYDPVNKPFSYLAHDETNPKSISQAGVFGILASKVTPGIVYVGTRGGGLNIFDPNQRTFEKVTFKVVDDTYGGSVRSIAEDPDGALWLGTWGDGLLKLDKEHKEVTRYKYEPENSSSISNNQVRSIKPDWQGKIWVGTNNGLNILDPKSGNFQRVISRSTKMFPKKLMEQIEELSQSDQVMGIIERVQDFEDRSLALQIKTAGNYLVMSVGEGDTNSMADYGWIENSAKDTIWHFGDFEESLYAGGAEKNRIMISSVSLQPGTYTLRYRTDDSHSFGKWNEEPPDQTSLYGIALIKPKDENQSISFQKIIEENQKGLIISGNNILDIEIGKTNIWVSAGGLGLNKIDPATNTIEYYRHNDTNENSLSSDLIMDIHEDSNGILWLATNEGINKLDPETNIFTRYSEVDGLPTNLTEAIVEGDQGEIWIATQNGISQMVTNKALDKVTFINYNSSDGLGGDVFLSLGATRASDGQYYFGGDHGLTTFSSVNANSTPPSLVISNLLISNKSVQDMGNDSPLTASLLNTDSIELSFKQNNLSFEFAALHFANPLKNQYAHKLIGYDKDWIYDNRNFAAYTNLDPGQYEFVIRASNAYGIWNEEGKRMSITISPPWWQTWWAYAIFLLLLLFFGYRFHLFQKARTLKKAKEESQKKELEQAKEIKKAYAELKATQTQLIQAEKMASLGELTAGIAHEIQNPLNFVNNFSEVNRELIEELKEEKAKPKKERDEKLEEELLTDIDQNLEKIAHHGKRADSIVKGMLQHSRASSGEKEPTDINVLADEYLRLAYHGLRAKDKSFNSAMETHFDNNIGKIDIIPQDMGRVILNLITNAFHAVQERKKQGEEGYEPTVSVVTKKITTPSGSGGVEVEVKDNGNGIPKKIIQRIFEPFFTTKPSGRGTGLGLSMSYEIVTKGHNGELKVTSKEGEGTTFTIVLPVMKKTKNSKKINKNNL
jgi:signal transduction histidine kinase/ligand-binding sensor domain-containing protein